MYIKHYFNNYLQYYIHVYHRPQISFPLMHTVLKYLYLSFLNNKSERFTDMHLYTYFDLAAFKISRFGSSLLISGEIYLLILPTIYLLKTRVDSPLNNITTMIQYQIKRVLSLGTWGVAVKSYWLRSSCRLLSARYCEARCREELSPSSASPFWELLSFTSFLMETYCFFLDRGA